jgi:predicted nucleic acid-binding protein
VKTLVVDASVAIKWVVQEPGSDAALAIRRYRLLAPDLLVAECANILWKKVRRGNLAAADALLAAALLERAGIELVPMRRMLERATALSLRLLHPANGCFYLALAETTGCDVVTADDRLAARAQGHESSVRVINLATALDALDPVDDR